MRSQIALLTILLVAQGNSSFGHGIGLVLNTDPSGTPATTVPFSQSTVPPLGDDLTGPGNLFYSVFGGTPNPDGSYRSNEGFAFMSGSWPTEAKFTFDLISPLWFADGTGDALPATIGTYINITDRYAGNSDGRHPGAATGLAKLDGSLRGAPGFQVSLTDSHELAKNLYLAPGGNADGAFGFAFTITAQFAGGQTLTSGPLADVWMTDIGLDGGFATHAPSSLQESAIVAVYRAVMRGDFNIDGTANNADLPPMLGAFTDLNAYRLASGIGGRELSAIGDVNGDGIVGNDDIQPLLKILADRASPNSVPEPDGLWLVATGLGILTINWRRGAGMD